MKFVGEEKEKERNLIECRWQIPTMFDNRQRLEVRVEP